MLLLRGTQKLRDRMRGPRAEAGDVSTTRLGDWFATAMFWKPHAVLLVNQRTLLPVFMPLAPAATLQERIPVAIADALRAQGASEEFIAAEVAEMQDVRIAKTNDRSTVGVMTEFVLTAEWQGKDQVGDLAAVSYELSSFILGPLHHRHGSPDRELAALLAAPPLPSNVVELRPGISLATPVAERPVRPVRERPAVELLWQLKVTLIDTSPPIWRRLVVSPATSLADLHLYIQAAFGWQNTHLYEFEAAHFRYGVPDPEMDWDFGKRLRPASATTMNMLGGVGGCLIYTYDFGDCWEHEVGIEQVFKPQDGVTPPACIGGERACPPEDCGGPSGYQELLAILADPAHAEHADRKAWLAYMIDAPFDPEAFDPSTFEANLATLRRRAR